MNLRTRFVFLLSLLVLGSMPYLVSAQLSWGGLPVTFSRSVVPITADFYDVETPSMDNIVLEDQRSPLPYRYAVNLPVDLGIGSAGQWTETNDGNRIWRLNVKSKGALALLLYFDRFNLPEGGKLFVYNPGRTQLLGAFTSLNNNKFSTFATGPVTGEELTLEYDAPAELPLPDLHISEVGHAYRGISDYSGLKNGFGGSGPCEVNINCTEGNSWQKQKRSVTRINVKRGSGSLWCTGSLVNNVRNDGTPYVITADHCGSLSTATDLSQWIFYFDYEGTDCPDPTKEPALKSVTGATLVAHGGNSGQSGSDFFLVLLNSDIPGSFNPYFNGWSLDTTQPSISGISIHHPEGDIKKISTYTTPLKQVVWPGGSKLSHWKVSWSQTINGHGTTEPGSSGSPLFDNLGRLIGTLTGGDSSCDTASLNKPDYYGMFSYSWDHNGTDSVSMLKCWLDPDNSGVKSVNGWSLSVDEHQRNGWISTYPNPVHDQLNVESSLFDGKKVHITIHDIWGKTRLIEDAYPGLSQVIKVDLSGFTAGIYLLEINGGASRMVRKIIRQ